MDQLIVNRSRIIAEFQELTSIDAESFSEREIADALTKKLLDIGFDVVEDDAGKIYGGNAGNIYGYLKGESDEEPILLSAHMDTVSPGIGKQAVIHEDGLITSAKDTVLGADDVAGLVEILEGIRLMRENHIPHRDIEILFPIGEEAYIKGTKVFDFSKIKSKEAYVLDMSGRIGSAALQAPSLISFKITIKGKAAHAGFEPEQGINAIEIASRAISKIKQGHVDEETTVNIGRITGGVATNIVSENCICEGEVRSYRHESALKAIQKLREVFGGEAEKKQAQIDMDVDIHMEAYKIGEKENVVQRFIKAAEELSLPHTLTKTFGGSDNNNFVKNGIRGIVLSCGMYNVHSVEEYTTIKDLEDGARLIAAIIKYKKRLHF